MRILRSAILAIGLMSLGLSFVACGGKDKGAEEPKANPCNPCNANPCNPCNAANPCNPCNPCGAANPCNPCAGGEEGGN